MEKQTASTTKGDPIIIEQAGMRMTVAHRHGLGGSDEGLTFDITTAGPEDECVFRTKSATHSDANRPPVPKQTGHGYGANRPPPWG
jgi:hypothetical protein